METLLKQHFHIKNYTGGRGRTDTPIQELDFESSASANSATPAQFLINKKLPFGSKNMERKIGFAPISRSGKERILKVEILPHY